jgi:hypothetical protein
MLAERKATKGGKISIKNNINITEISETDLALGKSHESGLVFRFEFRSIYEPEVGNITFNGEILYMSEQKVVKAVLDKWKKEKKVDAQILGEILNTALAKCNIQALILSQELHLPSPIPLPRVGIKKE